MNKLILMKRLMPVFFFLLAFPITGIASGTSVELMNAGNDIQDKESLRRGAHFYVNHCAVCHSARFMRYERIAHDLEIPEQEVMTNLVRFGASKITDTITASITAEMGKKIYGVAPPDLTLEANYRGADWVYTYLMGFYKDEKSPTGYNNRVMPNVAMPWVLASRQDSMSEEDFAQEMRDLTNFMVYMAEPIKPFRERIGKYILGFLLILLIPTWLLKREYWKDIH